MNKDKIILRQLAKKITEVSSLPQMEVRRDIWKQHNNLKNKRPLVLVYPEGAWRELIAEKELQCDKIEARNIEMELRKRIYAYENFYDDRPVEKIWKVYKTVKNLNVQWCQPNSWGIKSKHIESTSNSGSWGFDPIIKHPKDLKQLKIPLIEYDEAKSQKDLEYVQEIFGDVLDVKLWGVPHVSFHPMKQYIEFRGLEQMMFDVYDEPEMIHEAMSFFEEGYSSLIKQCREQNLLSLNNDDSWHGSGGVGYSDELPKAGFNPDAVRPCDIWASAEAQETTQLSPEMYYEFVYPYEKRFLKQFGLNGYGCCENLTNRLDYILQLPNIRRISISPWANVEKCAEKLGDKCIFSWKPHPAYLVGDFDVNKIREYIKYTLDVTKNCVLEIILKDTHTCENHPERFMIWTKIAKELIGN